MQDSKIQATYNDEQNTELPNTINKTYYEILFNVDCKESYLNDLIMQTIADTITEHGDGVEFLSGDMIKIEQEK